MTTMLTGDLGVMSRLRAETAERHKRAEDHRFQRSLLAGKLDRAAYGVWLGQMLVVHRALESAIDRCRERCEHLAVVTDEQRHSKNLEQDLRWLGIDPAGVSAMPGAGWLCGRIAEAERDRPLDLLGMHYVLEGSMNGNRYVVMAVRKGLGLKVGEGDRYLDPYGERQRELWATFKSAMSERVLSTEQIDAMVAAACEMFDGVGKISDDVVSGV